MTLSAEGRRVVLLAVVAVVLGGYVYLTTPEKKARSGPQEKTASRRVIIFSPEQVTKVEVSYEGESLVCQRVAQGWTAEPGTKELRAGVVEDFLRSLTELVEIGQVEEGIEGLAQYGLDRPTSRIVLEVTGKGPRTLALGSYNPVQTSVYAQVDDAPRVVLIGSVILWDMRKLFIAAKS